MGRMRISFRPILFHLDFLVSLVPVTLLNPLNSFNPLINPSPYKFPINKTKDILIFVD